LKNLGLSFSPNGEMSPNLVTLATQATNTTYVPLLHDKMAGDEPKNLL
jgi:hypothetical protein